MMGKYSICAAILVGGLGARLRPITYRVPKPLVKVAGKPFLHYVLQHVASMGVKKCILLTGYKHHLVKKFCGDGSRWGVQIHYSQEKKPLGTGGALALLQNRAKQTLLVMNGDTYLDLPLEPFLSFHKEKKSFATVLVMKGSLKARGAVRMHASGVVRTFLEKQKSGNGYFNTGAYLIEPGALRLLASEIKKGNLEKKFSMEKDGFPILVRAKCMHAYVGKGKFLDMGTVESLMRAHRLVG